ncbi:hypothetical protein B0H16DRAFT_1687443 [Mycena metata]|uniref:Uncharacterized protein n=1 Tax=Mycena metata TaxID=1033252 RepID=A0AAD7JI22_9AGAR|nr:hypothetical protein B0H16DRAFT_1687443 [Mycena metata]
MSRMPIALHVTIPTSSPSCISSSSSESTSAASSPSSATGPGVYVPVHRRAASSLSSSRGSSRSPPTPLSPSLRTSGSSDFPARIYDLATLLRLSCSPLATQMTCAPAMRAVPAILGVRPRKQHSTGSSPTGTHTEKVGRGHTEAVSAPATTVQAPTRRPSVRRNTISRERSALEGSWRPRRPESTEFTSSVIPMVGAV